MLALSNRIAALWSSRIGRLSRGRRFAGDDCMDKNALFRVDLFARASLLRCLG